MNQNDEKIHKKIEQAFEKVNLNEVVTKINEIEDEPIQVNIINNKSKQRKINSKQELLTIVSITEDSFFPLGENIISWKTIARKSQDNKHALIGQTNSSIIIATEKNDTYQIINHHDLNSTITSFDVFSHWNKEKNEIENVIVTAVENQIVFIKVSNDFQTSVIIWNWSIQKQITVIKYFKTIGIDALVLIIDSNHYQNLTSASVYHFNIETKHTWLFQMIPLNTPPRRIDVLDTGRDIVLCLIQKDTVILYKLNIEFGTDGRFEELSKYQSPNVNTVVAFQMGGHSYIAVGGLKPEILRYHRGQFIAQTILSKTWGLVEEFIPIVARTYRDDLILLVQHRINFDTHSLSAVEALIWDGESFDTSISVPCHIQNHVFSHGIACIMDLARSEGIFGTTVIQQSSGILSILVPRLNAPSGLFHINVTLKSFSNFPVVSLGISGIENNLKDFQKILQHQEATFKIEESLKNSLNTTAILKEIENIHFIQNVKATEYMVRNSNDVKINEIYFDDEKLNHQDEEIDILNLLEDLQETLKELELLEMQPTAETVKIVSNLPTNGKFKLENIRILPKRSMTDSKSTENFENLYVEHLEVNTINNVSFEKYVFLSDNDLKFNGTLIFDEDLSILDRVRFTNLPISNVVGSTKTDFEISKEINVDTLHVAGNINVQTINGIIWNDFLNRVVMTNLPNSLKTLNVNGVSIYPIPMKNDKN